MNKIQIWVAILVATWTLQSGAENASYTKDGLTFSGTAEAVKTFQEAITAYDDAERVQKSIREQKLPSTPENDASAREASSRWYSTRETMYQAALDMKIAPGKTDASSTDGIDALGTRRDIYTLNQFISKYQEQHADSPELYLGWLQEMLPAWKDCAGEADILLEIGRFSEHDPAIALTYFERAAKNDRDVDEYQFRRQEAYQGIARMHEKLGNFKAALEALDKWDIREPCGTGANGSRIKRMFWLWRLRRLAGEDPSVMRRELVHAMKADGWLISSAERDIIAFYGNDKSALKQDISDVSQTFQKSSDDEKKMHESDSKVLRAIIIQLGEEKRLAEMTDDQLIQALQAPIHRIRDDLPPTPMYPKLLFYYYHEQKTARLSEIRKETRYWVRAAEEALRRMPALESKLQNEWKKNNSYGAAVVLALHAMPDESVYLRDAAKSDDELQNMLDDMMIYQKSVREK